MSQAPQAPRSAAPFLQWTAARMAARLSRVVPDRGYLMDVAREIGGGGAELGSLGEQVAGGGDPLSQLGEASPLGRIVRAAGLSRLELDLLAFSLLPEIDDRFGEVFVALRGGVLPRRPTLGIALRALFHEQADRWRARGHLEKSPLWERGLFRMEAARGDAPWMDRVLSPSAPVVAAAFGHVPSRLDTGAEVLLSPASEEPLGALREGLAALLPDLCSWIEAVPGGVLHLVSENAGDAALLAKHLSRAFGRPLLHVPEVTRDVEVTLQLGTCCAVGECGLLLVEAAPAEPLRLPASFEPFGPVLLATPPRVEVAFPPGLSGRRVELPRPRPMEQASLWRASLGERAPEARIAVLANRTHLSGGQIQRASDLATDRAARSGRGQVAEADVLEALREIIPDPTSSLARWTRPRVAWQSLVLDRETRGQLEDLVHRIEHRVTVQDEWGLGGPSGRGDGVVALFHGEPGTGKTLAAEAIASRLGLSLLRVDLSRVVSKYIGETEKHLASLFDQCEGFRAVLFFDEADTLFAKRTGVKDAHDRYANLETNYMLSRLEAFEGVGLLATNLLTNVDTAFVRRLHLIVPFARPTPALRRRLWGAHLPDKHLAPEVELDAIAARHDLVGGEIRNAAVSAAFSAAVSSGRITEAMLDQAILAERIKAGKSIR